MVEAKTARGGGAAARGADAAEQEAFAVRTVAGVNAGLGQAPGKAQPLLAVIAKSWIQLADAASNKSLEATEQLGQAFLTELAPIENQFQKLQNTKRTNIEQQHRYTVLQQEMEQQILLAQDAIAQRKQQLADARLHRQHLEEYEVVRRLIAEQVPRHTTQARMDGVAREIGELEAEAAKLERAWQRRRQQAALLFAALDDLIKVQDDQELEPAEAAAAAAVASGGAAGGGSGGAAAAAAAAAAAGVDATEEGEAEEGEAGDAMQEG